MKRKRGPGRRSGQSVKKDERELLALFFKNVVSHGTSLRKLIEKVTNDYVRVYLVLILLLLVIFLRLIGCNDLCFVNV